MTLAADLAGKTALVTGASSDGLGRYFAQVLCEAGARVIVSARRKEKLDRLVAELSAQGHEAIAASLDVSDLAAVKSVVAETGPVDILVNNAGVSISKPILQQEEQDYDLVMDTNVKGAWNVAKEIARAMKENGRQGSIVNIASITGLRQQSVISPYAISKAAVIQMTKQMALEFARYGIRVNALAPGYFASEMTKDFIESDYGAELIERVPMKRLGDYGSLKGPLLMLADEQSSFITGAILPVDGGHLLSSL